jgi:hypothetical protein
MLFVFVVFLRALQVVMATPAPKTSWELLTVNPPVAKALAVVQGQEFSPSHHIWTGRGVTKVPTAGA